MDDHAGRKSTMMWAGNNEFSWSGLNFLGGFLKPLETPLPTPPFS